VKKQPFQKNRKLRVFAGPNGSGKSSLLDQIATKFDLGFYINADVIEKQLKEKQKINLSNFGIDKLSTSKFNSLIKNHTIIKKAKTAGYKIDLTLEGNQIVNPDKNTHSYEAAFVADILRTQLLERGKKFTYETVMSHPSKIEFFSKAQLKGYKNYLYFISTESPLINIERVQQRVKLGGHPVPENKIESRYYNALKNLKDAVQLTYRSFIFDNSGNKPILIMQVFKGNEVTFYHNEIPHWVDEYLLDN